MHLFFMQFAEFPDEMSGMQLLDCIESSTCMEMTLKGWLL